MRLRYGLIFVWLLSLSPAQGQDPEMAKSINKAIEKAVAHVKSLPLASGKRPGAWALWGWSLLEAGEEAKEPAIKKIADAIRQKAPGMTDVYDLALSIIFLDKLGDPGDEPLIEAFAVRLIGGQGTAGGWSYSAPSTNPAEKALLAKFIGDAEQLRRQGIPFTRKARTPREVADELWRQRRNLEPLELNFGGDNSNTQFALLGLWVARRHGVPVAGNLIAGQQRFQVSQLPSGRWNYLLSRPENDDSSSYPAMTCAGLMGLAMGEGVRPKPRDLLKDTQVQRGIAALAGVMTPDPPANGNFYYFLFSLERVAVIYNLKTIGRHDWYLWGAEILLKRQQEDGSWQARYSDLAADSCFGLLFLKRANVARDLSELLADPIRKASSGR